MSNTHHAKAVYMACSSGGHLNQLIELSPSLKRRYRISFITIERPDTVERLRQESVDFVPDLSKSNRTNLIKSLRVSYKLLKQNTPDVIITNGAGAVFSYVLLAKLFFGVPIILVESFARIDDISSFGKIVSLFARSYFVQWPALESRRKKARYCGTVFDLPTGISIPFPSRVQSVFVILGTTEFAFPRILSWVKKALEHEAGNVKINAQCGTTQADDDISAKQWMGHEEFVAAIEAADIVVTHAGSGAIVNAVSRKKYTICVPRLAIHNEHNDNHQTEIADAFSSLGYIKAAYSFADFQQIVHSKTELNFPDTGTGNIADCLIKEIECL